jgi:hypothetical protein
MTVDTVKSKVHTHTGTSPDSMVLQLKDEGGRLVAVLDDGGRKLGYFNPRNGWARFGNTTGRAARASICQAAGPLS